MWKEKPNMKKENGEIKAYMGEDTVFNGSLTFDGTVRIDGKFDSTNFCRYGHLYGPG